MEIYHSFFQFAPDAVLVVDSKGCIVKVNAQVEKLFGYSQNELIGQTVEILIPQRFTTRHIGYRSSYLSAPRLRTMGAGLELYGKRRDETEFPVDIMLSPLEADEGHFVMAVVRDVTEQKQAEQRLKDSLAEKEVLLKEIHHRVKNNLAVISSIFYLQSTYTQDEQTLTTLQESQDRIRSMALVHETLYQTQTGNFADLDFSEYVQALSASLFNTYCVATGNIRIRTDLEKLRMSIDLAVPCGLILNELISNALKHAFPNENSGEVLVALHANGDECVLCVSDDGVGMPANLEIGVTRSLGLRLVQSLARQIDGRVKFIRKTPGTEARVTFPFLPKRRQSVPPFE